MGTLDKDMLAIKNKPWLISLICAVFVIYPNAAWIFCDLSYLPRDEHTGFLVFFLFRFLYIWALIGLLVRYNLRHLSTPLFAKRLWINAALTLGGFAIYELLSHLAHSYDRFISILIFQFIVICLLCVFIGHIYLLYTYQREKEQEIERLRIENLQSRCDALAKQINPHFFFNSLNGISALIRKKNDERTLSYVTQLSDIFRYILQSDKKWLVTLDEELNFVEAFRHVMEVRYANKLCFRIDVPDARRDLRLPVLSLLPLLENVTVHNMIDSEHRMEISIRLNERSELVVSNPVYPKLTPPDTTGTGLKNVENRFALLMDKQIRIEADEHTFQVILPLT